MFILSIIFSHIRYDIFHGPLSICKTMSIHFSVHCELFGSIPRDRVKCPAVRTRTNAPPTITRFHGNVEKSQSLQKRACELGRRMVDTGPQLDLTEHNEAFLSRVSFFRCRIPQFLLASTKLPLQGLNFLLDMYDLYFSGARTAKYVRSIYTSLSQQTKINLLEEVIPPEKHNGEEEDDLL